MEEKIEASFKFRLGDVLVHKALEKRKNEVQCEKLFVVARSFEQGGNGFTVRYHCRGHSNLATAAQIHIWNENELVLLENNDNNESLGLKILKEEDK